MNARYALFTAASCGIVFTTIWAATAPRVAAPVVSAAEAPPAMLYADCGAVRAAGAAPLRAGQLGYRPALDPNMNGIACETVDPATTVPATAATPAPIATPTPALPVDPSGAVSAPTASPVEPIGLSPADNATLQAGIANGLTPDDFRH